MNALQKRAKAEARIGEQRVRQALNYMDEAKSALIKADKILEAHTGFRLATMEFLYLALRNIDNAKNETARDAEHLGYTTS